LFCLSVVRRVLYSFPTRRSSDLKSGNPRSQGQLRRLVRAFRVRTPPSATGLGRHFLHIPTSVDSSVQPLPSGWVAEFARSDHDRSEEHTSELQSRGHLVCRLLLE